MRHYLSRLLAPLSIIGGLLAAAPAIAQDCPPPAPAELEAMGTAYFEALNKGDIAALDALLAENYHQPQGTIMSQGRDLHLERLTAVRTGFPDGTFTTDWMFSDGDTIVIRTTFRGTHQGEFADVPASGNKVAVGAFHVHRVECGKIAETWNAADALGLFHQMGALDLAVSTIPDDEPAPAPDPTAAECATTTPEENAAAARRWYDEALNQRKIDVLDEIVWPEIVHHSGLFPDAVGIEAVKDSLTSLSGTFPDIQFSVDAMVASGDRVLIRWTGRGTHAGSAFLGVPTSGSAVDWSGMNAFRFACGKIIEGWSEADGLALLRQLGGMK